MKNILIFLAILISLSGCTSEKQNEYYDITTDVILFYREKLVNKSSFNLVYADVSDPSAIEEESFDYIIRIQFEYLNSDNAKTMKNIYVKVINGKFIKSDFETERQKKIQGQYTLNSVVPYRLNVSTVNDKVIKKSSKKAD